MNNWNFYPGTDFSAFLNYILSPEFYEDGESRVIRQRLRGRQLWTIREFKNLDGTIKTSIVLYQLKRIKTQWAWQVFDEAHNPPYYNCPISYLSQTTEINQEWRTKLLEIRKKSSNKE